MSKGEIVVYRRHRPESTTLYEVVRDNIETLFGAIDDGGLAVRIPKHARQELVAYLDCGLLCRGFAPAEMPRVQRDSARGFQLQGARLCEAFSYAKPRRARRGAEHRAGHDDFA